VGSSRVAGGRIQHRHPATCAGLAKSVLPDAATVNVVRENRNKEIKKDMVQRQYGPKIQN
jgi:hypothetical protein